MTQEQFRRVEELFHKAKVLANHQVNALLDAECGDDPAVRAEIEKLLAKDTPESSLRAIRQAAADAVAGPGAAITATATSNSRMCGTRVGGYTIIRELGRGGFGVVYEAQQESPRRAVALKVMRGGHYLDEYHVKLFQREAQALALLRHPCIGAIYEAGRTDDGQHFFAMELVRGRSLMDYVRQAHLTFAQRLELFRKTCDAIHYAHQKGVMHRDLKPSNVLIEADGNPKILDFGLAKITDADVAVTTVVTEIGQIAGTLPYMSPEQARGHTDEIDIRSDVYSMGVILYELLTDKLPYDLGGAMLHEAVRVICEEPPKRPSTISKVLRGDLETIALKALAKSPSHRYASAAALSDDVQRYLTDQPILARPPSAMYQLRKLVARHTAPFVFSGALALLVGASLIALSVMYRNQVRARQVADSLRREAVRERDRAAEQRMLADTRRKETQQVADFQVSQFQGIDVKGMGMRLRENLIDAVRATMKKAKLDRSERKARRAQLDSLLAGVDLTGVALKQLDGDIFQPAVKAVTEGFVGQPVVQAQLFQSLGDTLRRLGLLDRATAPQTQALAIWRRVSGDEHRDTLASVNNMGSLMHAQGKLDEAETYFREALGKCRRSLGDDEPGTLAAMNNLGNLLLARGKLAEAEPFLREALDRRRRVLGDAHPETLTSINNMGLLLRSQGKLAQAEPYYREALETMGRALGDEHPTTLTAISNMAGLLHEQRRLAEAEPYCRDALEKRRRALGDEHPDTLASIDQVGGVLSDQGKLAQAEPYLRKALEKRRHVLGDMHPDTLTSVNNVGTLLNDAGKVTEAEPYLREALEKRRRILGNEHPQTLISIHNMARLLHAQGKFAEAETYFLEVLEKSRRALGNEHPRTLFSIYSMGVLLQARGRPAEAERYYREALPGLRKWLGSSRWETASCELGLGSVLRDLSRFSEAEKHLLRAERVLRTTQAVEPARYAGCVDAIAKLYQKWHLAEPDERYDARAAQWRAKLADWQATTQPAATRPASAQSTSSQQTRSTPPQRSTQPTASSQRAVVSRESSSAPANP